MTAIQRARSIRFMNVVAAVATAVLTFPGLARAQAQYEVVYGFTGSINGVLTRQPSGVIVGSDGYLYGSTISGTGVVFKMTGAGAVTILHELSAATDGAALLPLLEASDGAFYGVATNGGAFNAGTIVKMTRAGTLTTLHAFTAGSDGGHPADGLIQATDGSLYGTTAAFGANGGGTIFRITPAGMLTTLYSFGGPDGRGPRGLTQASDGNFYGTTIHGGGGAAAQDGVVFKMTPSGTVTVLHAFSGADGAVPWSGVIQGTDGNLYGTTSRGGAFNEGTIFRITPAGTLTTVYSFLNGTPNGLVPAPNGTFYGTTSKGGVASTDTLFTMTPAGIVTVLYGFGTGDEWPERLVVTGDYVYGTTRAGGPSGHGVVFRLRDPGIGAGIDHEPPVLTVQGNVVVEAAGPTGARVDFLTTAVDLVDGTVMVTCIPASGSTFQIGQTSVDCAAADRRGNTARGSFLVNVIDSTPPVLALPGDIVVEAPGPAGAIVYYAGTALDLVDGSLPVTCTPASGSTFPINRTMVDCSAVDRHGNTARRSFSITVRDSTTPVLTLPGDIVVEATGPAGANVYYAVTAVDLVDGSLPVTCTRASGSTFPINSTLVDCSAVDRSGNTARGSFSVTVRDSTPPVLTLPYNIVVDADSDAGAAVYYVPTPRAVDVVGGSVPVTCTRASGSTFRIGTTRVDCSASDGRGNTAGGFFSVTVSECSMLRSQISEAKQEIQALQAELKYAPPGEKAALIAAIRQQQALVQKLTARARAAGCAL